MRHELSAATELAFGERRERRHMEAADDWMSRRRGRLAALAYAAINAAGCAVRLAALRPLARRSPARYGERAALEARYLRLHSRALRPSRRRPARSL